MPVQVNPRRAITVDDSGAVVRYPTPIRRPITGGATRQQNSTSGSTSTGNLGTRGNSISMSEAVRAVQYPESNSPETRKYYSMKKTERETVWIVEVAGGNQAFLFSQQEDDDQQGKPRRKPLAQDNLPEVSQSPTPLAQLAASILIGLNNAIQYTSYYGRVSLGWESLPVGTTQWQASAEAVFGLYNLGTLGGVGDIRAGVETGDVGQVATGVVESLPFIGAVGHLGNGYRALRGAYVAAEVARPALQLPSSIASDVLEILNNSDSSGVDFYVTPNGVSIPSEGYRYIGANVPYFSDLVETGIQPAMPDGTYFSFDRFDDPATAADMMQLPSIPQFREEFDTLQLVGDIYIPTGRLQSATTLEPIAVSYPELGIGGATQAITNLPIRINVLIDLATGRILYDFSDP